MKSPRHIVYGYEDPRTGALRYVGQSTTGLKRPRAFRQHAGHCLSLVKSLEQDRLVPTVVILETLLDTATDAELNEAESQHISFWRAIGCRLTNLTDGGLGCRGRRHTLASRSKISLGLRGNNNTLGLVHTSVSRETMRGNTNAAVGSLSGAHKARISDSMKGNRNARGSTRTPAQIQRQSDLMKAYWNRRAANEG